MRILVTGASGFAGSLLVPRLLSQGHLVRALGRDPVRVKSALARESLSAAASEAEIAQADVLSGEGLSHALDGVERM
jgi:uncharacterized protein YbjT (DUF2867 family)